LTTGATVSALEKFLLKGKASISVSRLWLQFVSVY